MKISPDTLQILKNFAGINQSLLFRKGSNLSTISTQKNTLASAVVAEVFPKDFAIYDLNEFLSVISTFDDPNFNVKENVIQITEEKKKRSAEIVFADPSMIVLPPTDTSKMQKAIDEAEIRFILAEEDYLQLLKVASILGAPEVAVQSDGKEINLIALDTKNVTSNKYSITLSEGNGASFNMIFKVENLKLLKGSYEVSISSKLISYFDNTDIKLEYYISLEQSSNYGNN